MRRRPLPPLPFAPLLLAAWGSFVFAQPAVAQPAVAQPGVAQEKPAGVDWEPAAGAMLTRWAADVDPAAPLPEYPRPQMTRPDWQNLNGPWDYAVTPRGLFGLRDDQWEGTILVPYPLESALSGVARTLTPEEELWYRRSFEVPADWAGRRVLLHFGAVDYECRAFVNGRPVGTHRGGYDPFCFDVTDSLSEDGPNVLTVAVEDPTWAGGQPRGKQTLSPGGIMYTPASGIWQTVWLEAVAPGGVRDLAVTPDLPGGRVTVAATRWPDRTGDGGDDGSELTVSVTDGDREVARGRGPVGAPLTLAIPDVRPWSPDDPHLYDLTVSVVAPGGETVDAVGSYVGMRSAEVREVDGAYRFLLNGEPTFLFGPLDQGFWPDGVYTAPTDAALKYDLEITKQFGFNMTRKHIKVEPARWYYHADQLGLMVWQDMPSANSYDADAVPGGRPRVDRDAYARELGAMVTALKHHPSVVTWVVFNEGQGQHATARYVDQVRALDPTRPINQASGGRHDHVGEFFDQHPYPAPAPYDVPAGQAFALGEYGGIGLKVGENNPWQEDGWGYTSVDTGDELEALYAEYAGQLNELRSSRGLAAAVYTQLTDVEIEVNGLLTYDRQLKVDPAWIAKATRFEWSGPTVTPVAPTARERPQPGYRYTLADPGAGWQAADADDSAWKEGPGGFGMDGNYVTGKVGTRWDTDRIWVRRTFAVPAMTPEALSELALTVFHDEDVEVFLNGVPVFRGEGYTTRYLTAPLSAEARAALRPGGENVLAASCRQTVGGQYLDLGLVRITDERNRDERDGDERDGGERIGDD